VYRAWRTCRAPSRRRWRGVRARKRRFLFRGVSVVLAVLSVVGSAVLTSRSVAHAAGRPNIVLILTDDQRWDTLWAMPAVRNQLMARGVEFTNGHVVNPLCCPSRASILTGQYSHSTGVYSNGPPLGGFSVFDDSSTLATWLHDDGYTTALIGKYLNGYDSDSVGTYTPPGWDRWVAFSQMEPGGGAYFNYQLNIDGTLRDFGTAETDYSTDVLAAEATDFIRTTTGPFFLYLAPSAPHFPATPPPRYKTAFSDLAPWRPPSYNEADVSDKPAWVRSLPLWNSTRKAAIDRFRLKQYRSLLAVNDAVRSVVRALRETGQLHDTMIVFTSDNGYLWGEHRWSAKMVPYEESIRIPLVARYDPLTTTPRADTHLALNIDFAPTFTEVAGTSAPGAEGRSLVPLLTSSTARWRRAFLIEHAGGRVVPAYCGSHNRRYSYVKYSTNEEELYDLRADPYQLQNRVTDPSYQKALDRMRTKLQKLCQPPTPGVTP
jgi:N-acetylglucosamine-6-sulfatase